MFKKYDLTTIAGAVNWLANTFYGRGSYFFGKHNLFKKNEKQATQWERPLQGHPFSKSSGWNDENKWVRHSKNSHLQKWCGCCHWNLVLSYDTGDYDWLLQGNTNSLIPSNGKRSGFQAHDKVIYQLQTKAFLPLWEIKRLGGLCKVFATMLFLIWMEISPRTEKKKHL